MATADQENPCPLEIVEGQRSLLITLTLPTAVPGLPYPESNTRKSTRPQGGATWHTSCKGYIYPGTALSASRMQHSLIRVKPPSGT